MRNLTIGIVLGALVMALLLSTGIVAHPVPAATSSDPAPLIRQGQEARKARAAVRERKCLPAVSYSRPFRAIPAGWRHYRVHQHRAKLARDLERPKRCLPTSSEGIIRYVFPAATEDAAVRVAYCESRLWTYAQNPSGASGLFQLMPTWWEGKFNPFDPWANTRFAHQLSRAGYDWSHWVCKP